MNRAARVASPALLLAAALAALFAALAVGGAAAPAGNLDPGAVVRYGLPVVLLIVNLSVAVTLGTLVLAVFTLSPLDPRWGRALDTAAAAAGVWTVAAGAAGVLAFIDTFLVLPTDPRFGPQLLYFFTSIALGQSWLATTLSAALITVLAIAVRSHTGVALLTAATVAALLPMSLQGHAANAPGDHETAISAYGLHIVFAAIWLGGLVALVLFGVDTRGQRLVDLVRRYSSIALACYAVVALTGVISAAIRLGSWGALLTPYGALIVVKSLALLAAGAFGALYRLVLIPRLGGERGPRTFFTVVAGELVVLGVASGFAAALSLSAPPDLPVAPLTTPAEILTGLPLPPPPSFSTIVTLWRPDLLWILVCATLLFGYLAGVVRLRRRGDRWPLGRTILWTAGVLTLFWLTSGALNAYEQVLFSSHMMLHMALTMLVPLLLVPAAPITLALRAIRPRRDGTRGVREWILVVVHSRLSAVLTNPIVAGVLFAGSLVVFYYSPLFSWATTDHVGHEWMTAHFLVTGYLFVQSLIGVDPSPVRFPYPLRLLILLATMAFHAFFGLALLQSQGLLLADWYGAMGWGTSALVDQQAAGGIAWSVGEIPTLALAIAVAVAWSRSDDRESRRTDRAADRDGDSDLKAYNEMLARLGRERG